MQAEANLHAASAQIGVAVANRLPNITACRPMRAARRWRSASSSRRHRFLECRAPTLAAPIFDGGTLYHQEQAARADYDASAAQQYRSTVLTAFQNVADTLTALQQDAEGAEGRRRRRCRGQGDAGSSRSAN